MNREDLLGLSNIAAEVGIGGGNLDYAMFGLKYNPFPASAVASAGSDQIDTARLGSVFSIPMFPPLRSTDVDTLRSFVRSALALQQFTGLQVVGDYGFGKSHLLRFLESQINGFDGSIRGGRVRAFYIKNPATKPQELLFALTRSIGQEDLRRMIWSIVLNDISSKFGDNPGAFSQELSQLQQQSLMGPRLDKVGILFEEEVIANFQLFNKHAVELGINQNTLRLIASRSLQEHVESPEIVDRLLLLIFGDRQRALDSWLSLTSSVAKGGIKTPQSEHFQAILKVMKLSGVSFVFLIIDEFEDIAGVRLTTRQRAEYQASMRMLIDSYHSDFALCLAATGAAIAIMKETYNPFVDRLTHRIDLLPLSADEVRAITLKYLNSARQEDSQEFAEDVNPFGHSIQLIHEYSRGNPRAVLNICHKAIERAREAGQVEIDPAVVRHVISS